MQAIYFDLDQTLADLAGVPNWLDKLRAEDSSPYADASPLVDMVRLAAIIAKLRSAGVTVGVISWGAMNGTTEYTREVKRVKREWCKRYGLTFDEFHVVKYGTPKHWVVKCKHSILVDDNSDVRARWSNGATIDATDSFRMMEQLEKLCQLTCNAPGQAGFMPTDEQLPAFAEWVKNLTRNQFCAVCDVLGIEEIADN